jgi:hypothetical protein
MIVEQLSIDEIIVFQIAIALPNSLTPYLYIVQTIPLTTLQFTVVNTTSSVGVSIMVDNTYSRIDGNVI